MKKRGFSKRVLENASSYEDITSIFDKYIMDTHLSISNGRNFSYQQKQRFDEGTSRSTDPEKHFEKLLLQTHIISAATAAI